MASAYEKLLAPGRIGPVITRNRIIKAATGMLMCELLAPLQAAGVVVRVVGDAVKPGLIRFAIRDGLRAALEV